ncbi:MAG: hypothetical protein KDF58_09130 [Alphaproteobacteria bacterium]|nr:hypothetical protein [Alphaproteobacteria bacterium]HPF46937.1 hypothetical protein [Emcibacteraceae bacterium]HRW30376.1 hypothetical protein [Emcibacteraceae bacterium]
MKKMLFPLVSTIVLTTTWAMAGEITAIEAAKEKLNKYSPTGEFEKCINQSEIKNATIIDDTRILFELRNNKTYLNTLDGVCSRLGTNRQFSYPPSRGKICSTDFITTERGPCGLGEFELLNEKPSS